MWGESGPWDFSTLCLLCDRLSNFLDFIDIHRPWTNSASFKRWNQTLSFSFLLHQLVELGLWWYKGWIIMFDYKRKTLLRRVLICLRWLLLLPCLSVAVPARPQRVMWLWGGKKKRMRGRLPVQTGRHRPVTTQAGGGFGRRLLLTSQDASQSRWDALKKALRCDNVRKSPPSSNYITFNHSY